MNKFNVKNAEQQQYDPRWFIWTIMFLIATGVGLSLYISTTGEDLEADSAIFTNYQAKRSQK